MGSEMCIRDRYGECNKGEWHKQRISADAIDEAIELGFDQLKQIQTDPDLEYLRKSDEFKNWAKTLNIQIT